MIHVAEAERLVLAQRRDFGEERLPLAEVLGRVLAEDIRTDRDLPPYDRVTMDGIAIRFADFAGGVRQFPIAATQAAGEPPLEYLDRGACIEVMTGAAVPLQADTVVRYEDLSIEHGMATVLEPNIKHRQNIHFKGIDSKEGAVVAPAGERITPAHINMAASVGKTHLSVRALPRCIIISSGDELVDVGDTPLPYQVRRSNNYTIHSVLQQYGIRSDMVHIPDKLEATRREIARCLEAYDVLLLSGGVSAGKFDYIPTALEELSVRKYFHKIRQRPGKPFWFGTHEDRALVFALPGNPVSTFMCLHRYFLPWLDISLGLPVRPPLYAILDGPVTFTPQLQYFLQVKLHVDAAGALRATPIEGNGSGDFSNLLQTDAFMELPEEKNEFFPGEVYRIWPFKDALD